MPPETMILYPNGGEEFTAGQMVGIEWSAVDNFEVQSVDIEYSSDAGGAWTPVATGIPNDGVYPWPVPLPGTTHGLLRVAAHDNRSNQGTDEGDDVFTVRTVTGVGDLLPEAFRLAQNRPNPFGSATTIRFDVPATAEHVRLTVYDVSGKLVRKLIDDVLSPGHKSVTWDGRDLQGHAVASGLYFYRLEAPGFSETRTMILMR
jgi:hypothetical protein